MHTIYSRAASKNWIEETLHSVSGRRFWLNLGRMISCWHSRSKQRHALSKLDDHLLRDIGVNHLEAERESAKPFWRA